MNDPVRIVQPKVRIETPIGAIESDTGNPFLDGIMVVAVISALYIMKKLADKFIRRKGK
tara:strand:+ start:177 stop:353 length:177 start_codon:yes stop_codon:yes gene_type:complete